MIKKQIIGSVLYTDVLAVAEGFYIRIAFSRRMWLYLVTLWKFILQIIAHELSLYALQTWCYISNRVVR